MYKENLIAASDICTHHHIEISFISSLQENGLIEVTTIAETRYIHANQLQKLETIIRMYHDLDINLEGIDTITHLLQRIIGLQDEITALKNRLRLYEEDF